MHIETASLAAPADRPVGPWTVLTGGSVGIVLGFGIDLLRLGVHRARQALAERSGGWRCAGPCDAGAR